MSEGMPSPEELRDAFQGLFPEADAVARQEGISQAFAVNERDAAVAAAVEGYETGQAEPAELAAWLRASYGPEAEQAFFGVWHANEAPEPAPPSAQEYLEQAHAHELVTQRALQDLQNRQAAEQQQRNAAEALAVIQERLAAHRDAAKYLPQVEASLMTWQPSTVEELAATVDRAVLGGREGERIMEAARAQAEARFSFAKVDAHNAFNDGLAGRDRHQTKAQWEAEKAARIDAATLEIAAEAAKKTEAKGLGEIAVDLGRVVPPTHAEQEAERFRIPVEQAQRREDFEGQVAPAAASARANQGKMPGGELSDLRKPKAYEPATIPTPAERPAPEPGSPAARAKAKQDQFWSNTVYADERSAPEPDSRTAAKAAQDNFWNLDPRYASE